MVVTCARRANPPVPVAILRIFVSIATRRRHLRYDNARSPAVSAGYTRDELAAIIRRCLAQKQLARVPYPAGVDDCRGDWASPGVPTRRPGCRRPLWRSNPLRRALPRIRFYIWGCILRFASKFPSTARRESANCGDDSVCSAMRTAPSTSSWRRWRKRSGKHNARATAPDEGHYLGSRSQAGLDHDRGMARQG